MATLTNQQSGEKDDAQQNTYTIRPASFEQKYRPAKASEIIREILKETLNDKEYVSEEVTDLSKSITDQIKKKLKTQLKLERYKYIVQVVIGEQRGQGAKMACRCYWDSDTDNYVQEIFMNDSLFCVAAAFGVYFY